MGTTAGSLAVSRRTTPAVRQASTGRARHGRHEAAPPFRRHRCCDAHGRGTRGFGGEHRRKLDGGVAMIDPALAERLRAVLPHRADAWAVRDAELREISGDDWPGGETAFPVELADLSAEKLAR